CHATISASCSASSASYRFPVTRTQTAHTRSRDGATSSANAARSPARHRSINSASSIEPPHHPEQSHCPTCTFETRLDGRGNYEHIAVRSGRRRRGQRRPPVDNTARSVLAQAHLLGADEFHVLGGQAL